MAFPCTEEVGGCGHPACRRERAEMAVRRAQCRHCKWGRPCDEHTRRAVEGNVITRKAVARELYIERAGRAGVTIDGAARAFEDPADSPGVIEAYDDADAVIALIQPEVPVQRDERAEKLGERLDAMVAEVNASNRIIARQEEKIEALEERTRELDAVWLRHTWPCGHISEGTGDEPDRCRICVAEERARNAEALAANLGRVDNERAIELMRVKRALTSATVGDAVGRLVKAVDAYTDYPSNRWSVGMTKLLDALNDPALAVWRGK